MRRRSAGAHADLDCDGQLSTFERQGRVGNDLQVEGAGQLFISDELE